MVAMKREEARVELPNLDPESVEQGLKLVRRKHPLYNTAIWKTLPYLKPIKQFIPSWVPRSQDEQELKIDRSALGQVPVLPGDEENKGGEVSPTRGGAASLFAGLDQRSQVTVGQLGQEENKVPGSAVNEDEEIEEEPVEVVEPLPKTKSGKRRLQSLLSVSAIPSHHTALFRRPSTHGSRMCWRNTRRLWTSSAKSRAASSTRRTPTSEWSISRRSGKRRTQTRTTTR